MFRKVFKHQLPYGDIDSDCSFSGFHFAKDIDLLDEPVIDKPINIGEISLVGVGAIGNSVLWTLKNITSISEGVLHIIDKEEIELSNLQRYLLSDQQGKDMLKVDIAEEFMKNSNIKIVKSPRTWQEHILQSNNWKIRNVVVCLDSAEDRIDRALQYPFQYWLQ